jgi:hypothetical protein
MTFTGTPIESPTLRWALLSVVLLGLVPWVAHLAGMTEVAAIALNPQPEPPGLV